MVEPELKMILMDLEQEMKSLGKKRFSQSRKKSPENSLLKKIFESETLKLEEMFIGNDYDEGKAFATSHLTKLIEIASKSGIEFNSPKEKYNFYFKLREDVEKIVSRKEYSIMDGTLSHGYHDGIDFYFERLGKNLL